MSQVIKNIKNSKPIKWLFEVFSIKVALPWILLLVGIALAVLGFKDFLNLGPFWQEIFKWTANLIIVSIIAGFFMSFLQFKKIFQQEITEAVYSDEFLMLRSDFERIWDIASSKMCDQIFPELGNELFSLIKKEYIKDKKYCCFDQKIHLLLEWDDKDERILKITKKVYYTVLAHLDGKYTLTSTSIVHTNNDHKYELKVLKINDEDLVGTKGKNFAKHDTIEDDARCIKWEAKLEGNGKPHIVYMETEEKQNINKDNILGFQAQHLIKNLTIQIVNKIDDDIDLELVSRGLVDGTFRITKSAQFSEYEYKGLVLKNQGYVLTIKQKYKNKKNN